MRKESYKNELKKLCTVYAYIQVVLEKKEFENFVIRSLISNTGLMVSLDRLEFADKNVHTLCRPDLCSSSNSTVKSYFPWL